jgi:excisionase family DNA binding protein
MDIPSATDITDIAQGDETDYTSSTEDFAWNHEKATMPIATKNKKITAMPTTRQAAVQARRSREALAELMQRGEDAAPSYQIRVSDAGQQSVEVTVPDGALRLLVRVLDEMAKGNQVTVLSAAKEITPRQAAELLGVSRPFLLHLLEREHIPYRYVGSHRRIRLQDLLAYTSEQERRDRILDELTAQAQELDMGY